MKRSPARRRNDADEFWRRVDKTATCWMWTSDVAMDGYGKFHYLGRTWRAHRLAWLLSRGSISATLLVCHRCDVPLCVRPDHLFLGTQKQNIEDCVAKGRRKGMRNNTKLMPGQAQEIREAYATGTVLQRELGKKYGIAQGHVSAIVNRYKGTWV